MARPSMMTATAKLWHPADASRAAPISRGNRPKRSIYAVLAFAAIAVLLLGVGMAVAQQPPAPTNVQPVAERAAEIEERLIDLQVQVATMRSLAANASSVATVVSAPQTGHAVAAPHATSQSITTLETELVALVGELEQLSGKPSSIRPSATSAERPAAAVETGPVGPQGASSPPAEVVGSGGWFGSTTVTPNSDPAASSPSGEILPQSVFPGASKSPAFPSQPNAVAGWAPAQPPAAEPPPGTPPSAIIENAPRTGAAPGAGTAEMEYQTAYGYLLQQDYGAAQTAFSEFVARYPNIPLAGNAQYWIGETHYVQGAYKAAAVAFLKGFETYGDGNKGPDSLLKLALSLGRLDQVPAACASLRELGSRYPSAPLSLHNRGKEEMRRLKC